MPVGSPPTGGLRMTTQLEAQPQPAAKPVTPSKPAPADRVLALDAYRGFVMIAMVSGGLGMAHLIHDPHWGWLADQMEHRKWEGCTFWDLIQPSFMFLVGASMPFAFARRQEKGDSWGKQFLHAVRRSLLLIGIGVFLDVYADQVVYVQFIRVLQQIALGYLLAFLVLHKGPWFQAAAAAFLLVWHTLAFLAFGWAKSVDPWNQCYNFGTWVDLTLHLPLSKGGYVTVNAVSSAATILLGVLAGELIRRGGSKTTKLIVMIIVGVTLLMVGWALGPVVPLVKRIWTSSFTLLAGGWTFLMLAVFYGLVEVVGWRRWTFPLVVVGMNSIAAYVIAGVLGGNVKRAVAAFLDVPLKSYTGLAAPVILAVLVVAVQWSFCYWLYRHKIFFKV